MAFLEKICAIIYIVSILRHSTADTTLVTIITTSSPTSTTQSIFCTYFVALKIVKDDGNCDSTGIKTCNFETGAASVTKFIPPCECKDRFAGDICNIYGT